MDLFARYAICGNNPAVFEIGQSMTREHPDAPTIILIQGLRPPVVSLVLGNQSQIEEVRTNRPRAVERALDRESIFEKRLGAR